MRNDCAGIPEAVACSPTLLPSHCPPAPLASLFLQQLGLLLPQDLCTCRSLCWNTLPHMATQILCGSSVTHLLRAVLPGPTKSNCAPQHLQPSLSIPFLSIIYLQILLFHHLPDFFSTPFLYFLFFLPEAQTTWIQILSLPDYLCDLEQVT